MTARVALTTNEYEALRLAGDDGRGVGARFIATLSGGSGVALVITRKYAEPGEASLTELDELG